MASKLIRRSLLAIAGMLIAAPVIAADLVSSKGSRELFVQLGSGAETAPSDICIVPDDSVALAEGVKCKDPPAPAAAPPPIDASSCPAAPPAEKSGALRIRLQFERKLKVPIHQLEKQGQGAFRILYTAAEVPSVITVRAEADSLHHASEPKLWWPAMGSTSVALSVVPCSVRRQITLPHYECPQGKIWTARELSFEIDEQWHIQSAPPVDACDGQMHFDAREPHAQSLASKAPVVYEVSKFSFEWLVHPLFECPGSQQAVAIAASESGLLCSDAHATLVNDERGLARYRWSDCSAQTLPGRVTLQATCPLYEGTGLKDKAPRWTDTLRHAGQVLSEYTPDQERTVIVVWKDWLQAASKTSKAPLPPLAKTHASARWSPAAPQAAHEAVPLVARKDRPNDNIFKVRLRDSLGQTFELIPPDVPAGGDRLWKLPRLERLPVAGVQSNQAFQMQYESDRVFKDASLKVEACDPMSGTIAAAQRDGGHKAPPAEQAGNCLVLEPPREGQRRDAVTLGLRIGTGLGAANPQGAPATFFSPTGELGLNVLKRSNTAPIDYEVSLALLAQRWKSYVQNVIEGPKERTLEAAPLLVLALEPGVRRRFLRTWSAGFFLLGGWGGPAFRHSVSSISDQFVGGFGASLGYYWSRTVALDLRPRFLLAQTTSVALDAGGLSEVQSKRPTWLLQIPVVARFDDIAGN